MWWAVAAAGVIGFILDIFVMAWLTNRMRKWLNGHKVLGK